MIDAILTALIEFYHKNEKLDFIAIFGDTDGPRLWSAYRQREFNLIEWYIQLNPAQKLVFQAHLSAQLPPVCFDDPRCVECGGPLTSEDIEAGEDVCLDCAAELALRPAQDTEAERGGLIEHEPGSLTATVRVEESGD